MTLKGSPKSFLITGANRGLGFEMVKQISTRYTPTAIFATYRDPNSIQDLQDLAKKYPFIIPVMMDVGKPETFAQVVEQVRKVMGSEGLEVLINNAGVFQKDASQTLEGITQELMLKYLQVNTFGAIFVTQAFLPLLEQAGRNSNFERAVIINFSSKLGSTGDNSSGGYYASRCTRAALNAATKSFGIDLKDRNILAVAINPGWVQTDQGGSNAPLTPQQSVGGILNVLDNLDASQSGTFIQYDGKILPW